MIEDIKNKILAPKLKQYSLYWMQAVHGASYRYRPRGGINSLFHYLLYPRLYLKNKSRNNGTFFVDELIIGANPILTIKRINELESMAKEIKVGVIISDIPDYWSYCSMPGLFNKKFGLKEDDYIGAIKALMFKTYKYVNLYFPDVDTMGVVGLKFDKDNFFLTTLRRHEAKKYGSEGYNFSSILDANNAIREKYKDAFFKNILSMGSVESINISKVEYPKHDSNLGYLVSNTLCITSSISFLVQEKWSPISKDVKTITHEALDNGVVCKMGSGKMVADSLMKQFELSMNEVFAD